MSNLKRHFNFGHHKPLPSLSHSRPMATEPSSFSKVSFMNEIGNCLELCSTYIQALNSLCSAGFMLAQSLKNIVKDVPLYNNLAGQFLGAWEDISQATAGASAAVKTETLMMLQDILFRLEGEANGTSEPVVISDRLQGVGFCLVSYMELQSQFSMSSSRTFSKLVKNDNLDSADKFGSLKHTLKKHFGHMNNKFNAPKLIAFNQSYSTKTSPEEVTPISPPPLASWKPPEPNLDSLNNYTTPPAYNLPNPTSPVRPPKTLNISNELEDVINLLSCKPGGEIPYPESPPKPVWPPMYSSNNSPMDGKRTWPRVGNNSSFGFDHMLWSLGNLENQASMRSPSQLNSANGNPMWPSKDNSLSKWGGDAESSSSDNTCSNNDTDVFSMGIDLTGHDLVASVRQRRHSSSDGNPDLNLCSEQQSAPSIPWEVRTAKTCTWPLKQMNSPFDYNLGRLSEAKYSLFGFPNT